ASPDFIALGDFTGNGNSDLVIAARGSKSLFIFPGDGKGNFGDPQMVSLAGGITALAAGRFGQQQSMLMVGLTAGKSSSLLVLVGSQQGVQALGSYALSGPASNIVFGDFGDGPDVAFLSGGQVQILRSSSMRLASVSLPASVSAFALGSFLPDRNTGMHIALL